MQRGEAVTKHLVIGLLITVTLGCSASSLAPRTPQERLGDEFVKALPDRDTKAGWKYEIHPDQQTIDRMRLAADRHSRSLVAAAFITTGIHPYHAISFTTSKSELEVIDTAMSWGKVQGKWVSTVASASYDEFIGAAQQLLACKPGDPIDSTFGALLVYWKPSGEHVVCSGDWGSEEAAQFGQLLDNLLPRARQTYKP
jgi:hypothetical protein